MGWGTDFKADIFLNKVTYSSKGLLEDDINETKKDIQRCKNYIIIMTSSGAYNLVPDEWKSDIVSWINSEIKTITDSMEEYYIKLVKLELYLEYVKENKLIKIDNKL
jgi:hypothetical protein